MVDIELCGETLTLLPQRALYWGRRQTLFIADLHLGKAATFRAYGIPVPEGNVAADLERLSHVVSMTGARQLIILGDLLHAKKGREDTTLDAFQSWRAKHADLAIHLIRGNHDQGAGDPPAEWNIHTVNGPTPGPVFVLAHEPLDPPNGYALTGHLHPAAQLTGKGRQLLKLPCFWFGRRCGVLPAFGTFTGNAVIQAQTGDRVFVIAGDKVVSAA